MKLQFSFSDCLLAPGGLISCSSHWNYDSHYDFHDIDAAPSGLGLAMGAVK
jgi:hypothetical protein